MTTIPDELEQCVGGLTVRDPWAQAIAHGPKRIENRSKRPPEKVVGERIAIHCGKSVDDCVRERVLVGEDVDGWGDYDLHGERHHPGHIIGTVRVIGYVVHQDGKLGAHDLHDIPDFCPRSECRSDGEIVPSYVAEHTIRDPWWQGPIGWLLTDPQPLDEPIPARGQLGVWGIEKQIAKVGGGS